MKIAIVGTGYVGLVTGTCFAETGNIVTCVDIDKSKVEKLSGGQITIYEPGLENIFLRNIKEGRLKFTTQLEEAVADAEIIFLALPTPPGADGSADLKYVLGVADHLGKVLKGYNVDITGLFSSSVFKGMKTDTFALGIPYPLLANILPAITP